MESSTSPSRDTARAMSQENVELVRRLLDMFARRDHEESSSSTTPISSGTRQRGSRLRWTPEWAVSLVSRASTAATRVFDLLATLLEPWKDLEFEVEHVLDAGDEVVALIRNQRQVGRHSGIVIEMPPYGLVFTIRVASSCAGGFIRTSNRHSKPPGCGSRALSCRLARPPALCGSKRRAIRPGGGRASDSRPGPACA